MKQPFRRAVSALCAFTLAASLVPAVALANGGEERESSTGIEAVSGSINLDNAEITIGEPIDIATTVDNGGIDLLSNDGFKMPLKEGSYEKWIDRVVLGDAVRTSYEKLEEASDNDGFEDYLIEDKYVNGEVLDAHNFHVGKDEDGVLYPTILFFAGNYETEEGYSKLKQIMSDYTLIICTAFNRDHAEVFWLGTVVSPVTYTQGNQLVSGIVVGGPARSALYPDERAIKKGIADRDAWAESILAAAPSEQDPEERIRYFNEWLTKNNEYNTSESLTELRPSYLDAWTCMSALEGREGVKGPVCEAYARAFKVLCDRSNIPCVLADGMAVTSTGSGAHMWNSVNLGGGWYGVDVTWNDPRGGKGGKVSGVENTKYLLVGADTVVGSMTYGQSHPETNALYEGYEFPNGPELSSEKYVHDCSKMGHVLGEKTIQNEKNPSCEANGGHDEVRVCKYCPYEEINYVEESGTATGHDFGEWTVSKNATCEAEGEEKRICVNVGCTHSEAQKINALGHDMGAWKTARAATCTVPGAEVRRCAHAGCSYTETRAVAAAGHAFGAYRSNGDAKVGVNGTETATCSKCGARTTRTAAGSALAPARGQVVTVGGASYAVTGAAAVAYAGPASKAAASATVPATVKVSGRTYKVTSISSRAFAGNKKLKSVKIGANVTAIPAGAFKGCTKLSKVTFGAAVKSVGSKAFYGCKSLKSVTLGKNATFIGASAFQNCAKLTKVTVKSAKLKTVGKSAFAGCKKLKSVSLKTTKLKSVGKNALKGTAKKLAVKVPKSKVRAYQKLFKSKGSKTVRVTK